MYVTHKMRRDQRIRPLNQIPRYAKLTSRDVSEIDPVVQEAIAELMRESRSQYVPISWSFTGSHLVDACGRRGVNILELGNWLDYQFSTGNRYCVSRAPRSAIKGNIYWTRRAQVASHLGVQRK